MALALPVADAAGPLAFQKSSLETGLFLTMTSFHLDFEDISVEGVVYFPDEVQMPVFRPFRPPHSTPTLQFTLSQTGESVRDL